MRKLNMWGLALGAVVVSGAVAATSIAPALTRADGDENAVAYVLDPESGAYVNEIQQVTINFPELKGVQVNDKMPLPVVLVNAETGAEYVCDYPTMDTTAEQGTSFTIKFNPSEPEDDYVWAPISEPGTYTMVIKGGAFYYGEESTDEDGNVTVTDQKFVQEIRAEYIIAEPGLQTAYVLDPADEAYVNEISEIHLTFPEVKGIQVNENMPYPVVLQNALTGEEYVCEPTQDTNATEGTAFTLKFNSINADLDDEGYVWQPISAVGTYKLIIKGGAFYYGEEVTDEEGNVTIPEQTFVQAINATYTIAEPGEQTVYDLDPVDGAYVKEIAEIHISFPNVKGVQVNENMPYPVVLTNAETGAEYICEAPTPDTNAVEGTSFIVKFNPADADLDDETYVWEPITELGVYELSVKGGAFFYGEESTDEEGNVTVSNPTYVQAIKATYTIGEAPVQTAYTLEPENGTYVNEISEIRLNFPEVKGVQVNDKMPYPVVLTNAETGAEYVCVPTPDAFAAEGTSFIIRFNPIDADVDAEDYVWEPISAAGTYKLSIKGGAFFYGEEATDEEGNVTVPNPTFVEPIEATYVIASAAGEQAEYVLDPEDGAYVNEITEVHVSFPTIKGVQVNENMPLPVVLTNAITGEEYVCDYPIMDTTVAEGTSFIIKFNPADADTENEEYVAQPITEPGTYELSIKGGAFFYGEEVTDEEGNVTVPDQTFIQPIKATYTIAEPLPQVAYELNPVDGATVEDLQTIYLHFTEMKGIQVNPHMPLPVVLTNTATGEEYYSDPDWDTTVAEGTMFILNFISSEADPEDPDDTLLPIITPGTYELSIKQGAFIYGDEVEDEEGNNVLENIQPVQAINATYTILSTVPDVAYTLNPENNAYVEDLQRVTITFPGRTDIQLNEKMPLPAVLTNITTGEEYYCDPDRDTTSAEGISFIFNFISSEADVEEDENALVPITAAGTYVLNIKQGAFIYGDEVEDEEGNNVLENIQPVQAINATYYIVSSGVNEVFGAEVTEYDVYSINGIQILKAADSDAVNALPAGLYIINGKKVIKK